MTIFLPRVEVKSYLDLPGSPMMAKEVGYFVDCAMRDDKDKANGVKFSFDDGVAKELGRVGLLLKDRVDAYKSKISFVVGCLVINLSRNDQDLVMWAWTLSKIYRKIGMEVDFDSFVDHFSNGIPSYALRMELFKSQLLDKGGDCLLNHPDRILFN